MSFNQECHKQFCDIILLFGILPMEEMQMPKLETVQCCGGQCVLLESQSLKVLTSSSYDREVKVQHKLLSRAFTEIILERLVCLLYV